MPSTMYGELRTVGLLIMFQMLAHRPHGLIPTFSVQYITVQYRFALMQAIPQFLQTLKIHTVV
jgi:hypothetical protein